MLFALFLVTVLLVQLCISSPIVQRLSSITVDDGTILNYALTLEYLERAFYRDGLAMFSRQDFQLAGYPDLFYDNLLEIYLQELTHVTFLTGALLAAGVQPTVELEYSFPMVDAQSFVTLASVFESLGTSAYLGAAAYIANNDYLTATGSIVSTEGRHTAYLRASLGESPFPDAFNTPLNFNQAYSLATLFITQRSLAQAPVQLPFQAFPALTLACSPYYYEAGRSSLTFTKAFSNAMDLGITAKSSVFAVFVSGLQMLPVAVRSTSGSPDYKLDSIPVGPVGQIYVLLSTSDEDFSDPNILAGPAILEVYPKGRVPSAPHATCS